jgi:aldehyde dehydrogenase (NAD+)
MIAQGMEEGARLIAGGPGKPEGFNRGWYVRPTVFADVTKRHGHRPAGDLRPGPEHPEGARTRPTPSSSPTTRDYGLAAYVQTGDPDRAERVASRLRAGAVHVNGGGMGWGTPFGGYKASGNGREGGILGIEDYQEVKSLHFG